MTDELVSNLENTEIFVPFVYSRKDVEANTDTRIVYGMVSDSSIDSDKQRCEPKWLKKAITDWYEWGNIRLMHKAIAVGTAIGLVEENEGSWYLTSKIVDPEAVRGIEEGLYKGYSIGINWPKVKADGTAPMGLIVGGEIIEVSIVDHPANPGAKFALIKAVGLDKSAESQCCAGSDCCDEDCAECENLTCDCDGVLKAAKGDDEESVDSEIQAQMDQKAASKKDDNQRKSPPKGYPKDKDQYADPANYRYPIDEGHIKAAISFYNAGRGKSGSKNWTSIGKRIASAASRIYGKKYELVDGKVVQEGTDKSVEINKSIGMTVAESMGSSELEDAQLCFSTAYMIRELMIRELQEDDMADSNMWQLCRLIDAYNTLMDFGAMEVQEAAVDAQDVFKILSKFSKICNISNLSGNISKEEKEVKKMGRKAMLKAANDNQDRDRRRRDAGTPAGDTKKSADSSDLMTLFKTALADNNKSIMEAIESRMAGYEKTLAEIGDMAKPDGVLQTSVIKSVTTNDRDARVRELTKLASVYQERSLTHSSSVIRTDASQKYLDTLREIDKLSGL